VPVEGTSVGLTYSSSPKYVGFDDIAREKLTVVRQDRRDGLLCGLRSARSPRLSSKRVDRRRLSKRSSKESWSSGTTFLGPGIDSRLLSVSENDGGSSTIENIALLYHFWITTLARVSALAVEHPKLRGTVQCQVVHLDRLKPPRPCLAGQFRRASIHASRVQRNV
jgi:hypothetical protein